MRLVLDTNVLIAALIAHGACHEVLERCIQEHQVVASPFLFDELRDALVKKFGYHQSEANEAARLLRSRMIVVTPQPLDKPASRDADDEKILGTALAGACRCIVTGDKDLLILKRYRGIDIITPSTFWRYEQEK